MVTRRAARARGRDVLRARNKQLLDNIGSAGRSTGGSQRATRSRDVHGSGDLVRGFLPPGPIFSWGRCVRLSEV